MSPLRAVGGHQVAPVRIRRHGLGHPSHEHVLPPEPLGLAVERLRQVLPALEGAPDHGGEGALSQGPQELLEVHRAHLARLLLRGNQDVADILLYRDEGACLDVVVAAVCHEVLYELACLGEGLHLVENDEGPALPELGAKLRRQVQEEAAHVRARIEERLPEVIGHLREVDQQVRLVLRLGELFDDRRLPNAARTLDEERR